MMNFTQIIEEFDRLDEGIIQLLQGNYNIEADPPLSDLNTRLNMLCASVLKLPMDNMPEAKMRMKKLQESLQEISAIIKQIERLKQEEAEKLDDTNDETEACDDPILEDVKQ